MMDIKKPELLKRLYNCIILLLIGMSLTAQTTSVSSAEVKAAFLYNFATFSEWPAEAFANPNSPFTIGVLGENPFGTALNEIVLNETKGGRPLTIKYFSQIEDVKDCQILFINLQKPSAQIQALEALKKQNVLTVGDTPDFVSKGGMIRFFVENNKLRFQVNLSAIKESNITLSSKLLRLAEIFNNPKL